MHQLSFLNDDLVDPYQVSWDDKSFGFVATNGRVTSAPPIARWALGVPVARVIGWYTNQGASVIKLGEPLTGADHERRELPGADPDGGL